MTGHDDAAAIVLLPAIACSQRFTLGCGEQARHDCIAVMIERAFERVPVCIVDCGGIVCLGFIHCIAFIHIALVRLIFVCAVLVCCLCPSGGATIACPVRGVMTDDAGPGEGAGASMSRWFAQGCDSSGSSMTYEIFCGKCR